jgi:uncharacterized protein
MKSIFYVLFMSWLGIATVFAQQPSSKDLRTPHIDIAIPERPASFVVVFDRGNILTEQEEEMLSVQFRMHRDTIDMTMVSVESLQNTPLEAYSQTWMKEWSIGSKGKYGGILFFVSKKDKKIRIQLDERAARWLSNEDTKSLIDNHLTPNFKKEYHYKGFFEALGAFWGLWRKHKK